MRGMDDEEAAQQSMLRLQAGVQDREARQARRRRGPARRGGETRWPSIGAVRSWTRRGAFADDGEEHRGDIGARSNCDACGACATAADARGA